MLPALAKVFPEEDAKRLQEAAFSIPSRRGEALDLVIKDLKQKYPGLFRPEAFLPTKEY